MRRRSSWALALCCLLLLASRPGGAQVSTADVLGTVTDPSGAPISNAKVVLTSKDTHAVRTILSNASGEYTFTLLASGSYTITATAPGFKSFVIPNFTLAAGDRLRENIPMSVGENTETVEVTAAPPSLDTDSSALSTEVTTKQVQELPLNGRNFVQLAQLAAGANEAAPTAISNGNRPDDRRQTAAVSVYAQSDTLNNELG